MVDLMSMFRGPATQQTQPMQASQASQATQPSNPADPAQAARSDGSGPAAFPKAGVGDKDPLDNFKDLFVSSASDPKKPNPVPDLKVTPEQLQAAVRNIDFTKAIDPALLTKALGGDQTAMMEVINKTSQQALAAASGTTASIVEDALTRMNKKYEDEIIPAILRKHTASGALADSNPIFLDPATKPLLDGLEAQLLLKYPTAPKDELTKMAKSYLLGFSQKFLGGEGKDIVDRPTASQTAAKAGTDWEAWFKG